MAVILGIDAAWTASEPSGVALVALPDGARPRCVAAAPSYLDFLALADGPSRRAPRGRPAGSPPNIPALLVASKQLAGAPVTLVAVDMPMARVPFSSRREADQAVSREFGGRNCGTHSPSAERPGPMGAALSSAFERAGFPLRTTRTDDLTTPALIEVYPHPALLSLLRRDSRVPYKVSKLRKYWPELEARARIGAVLGEFAAILEALEGAVDGIDLVLPRPDEVKAAAHLKRHEDVLDALICTWVGLEHLAGRTMPFGDETAAIWCPGDVVHGPGRSSPPAAGRASQARIGSGSQGSLI